MTKTYLIEDYTKIMSEGNPYILTPEFYVLLESIDKKIIPIFTEKVQDSRRIEHKKRQVQEPLDNWSATKPKYKSTIIEKPVDGIEKWIQEIRVCINKMSLKNYENQKTAILGLLEKCLADQEVAPEQQDENFKKIADFIFSVASSNIFFASIYASLFAELMSKYKIFNDLLRDYLNSYVSSVNKLKYVDPDENYDDYCLYNKENDMRKANAVFIIHLVKQNALPAMRVLTIITSFQDLTTQYIDEDNRIHEVEEISEILYLFLKEGKCVFQECQAEFIWKFVIIPNIEKVVKYKKGDKKSLSTRSIFKYMDIYANINNSSS